MSASPLEKVVLGIDAAWTAANPSGVALAARTNGFWHLIAAVASFEEFVALSGDCRGSGPAALVTAAACLAGRAPDLVAVDMPMMDAPIIGRRSADNAVNRAYAGRGAGTHSPTATAPAPSVERWKPDCPRSVTRLRPWTSSRPAASKSIRIRH